MPGPPPKPASKRIHKQRNDVGLVQVNDSPAIMPAPQKAWLKATTEHWAEFWTSSTAQLITSGDHPALRRMFDLYDERQRCLNAVRRQRLVKGSTGQPTAHPLYKQMATIDSQLTALEDRFGLTPKARLQLGVTFGEAHRSLEQMNRDTEIDDGSQDPDEEDPRFVVLDARSAEAR